MAAESNLKKVRKLAMDMDIEELRAANKLIVDEINFRHRQAQAEEMTKFRVDDAVEFTDRRGNMILGTITNFNEKTVGVLSKAGVKWKVSPGLLTKTEEIQGQ